MKSRTRIGYRVPAIIGLAFCASLVRGDDWPQWLGPERDGIWRETGIIEEFPGAGPSVLWRTKIGGGYSGPAVVQGRLYITDRQLARGAANPANPFDRASIPGTERVLCLSEANGSILWRHEYPAAYTISYAAGPRTTPVVSAGRVYTLGAEGDLLSLNAANGQVVWSRDLKKDYGVATPLWGFSAHPLVDGEKLICLVGGDGSTVVAFNKNNGEEIWRALTSKEPGYCPPMIYTFGGRRELIVWHPESINALDPETGEVHWTEPFAVRSGLSIPTPRKSGDFLYLTCFYNGSRMLKVSRNGAATVWKSKKASERDTDALHSIIGTPFIEDGNIFGVCSYGQLRCLNASSGERVWGTLRATTPDGKPTRWANAFLVKQGDRFFLWNERGELIIARLNSVGYHEISRARLLKATNTAQGRDVLWSHPAFANRNMYARNDEEIICVSLASDPN